MNVILPLHTPVGPAAPSSLPRLSHSSLASRHLTQPVVLTEGLLVLLCFASGSGVDAQGCLGGARR